LAAATATASAAAVAAAAATIVAASAEAEAITTASAAAAAAAIATASAALAATTTASATANAASVFRVSIAAFQMLILRSGLGLTEYNVKVVVFLLAYKYLYDTLAEKKCAYVSLLLNFYILDYGSKYLYSVNA
jgi:hypothetical protein